MGLHRYALRVRVFRRKNRKRRKSVWTRAFQQRRQTSKCAQLLRICGERLKSLRLIRRYLMEAAFQCQVPANPVNPSGLDPKGELQMVGELGPVVRAKGVFTKAVRLSRCSLEGAAEGQPSFRTALRLMRAQPLLWGRCSGRCPHRCSS